MCGDSKRCQKLRTVPTTTDDSERAQNDVARSNGAARQARCRGAVQTGATEDHELRSYEELFREYRLRTITNCFALTAQGFLDNCVVD